MDFLVLACLDLALAWYLVITIQLIILNLLMLPCSEQVSYLWDNQPEECLEKCRQCVDIRVLHPNEYDTRPFAQANLNTLNKVF